MYLRRAAQVNRPCTSPSLLSYTRWLSIQNSLPLLPGTSLTKTPTTNGPFYGWFVVAASFATLTVAYSLQFTYGVFLPYIEADLGLDRASASAPWSIYVLVYSGLSFLTGRMTDRLGPRRVVISAGLLLGLGYGSLSFAAVPWHLFVCMSIIAGIGMSATFLPVNATIIKWFIRRRSLALAITGSGVNVAAFTGPMAAALLIPLMDWREAMLLLGLSGGAAIIVFALALHRDPETKGQAPDGRSAPVATGSAAAPSEQASWTLAEARQTSAFWLILCIFFLTWSIIFFPYIHLPVIAVDLGYGPAKAAGLVGALGIGGIIGRLFLSWLSEKIGHLRGLYITLGVQVAGCVILTITTGYSALFLAACLFSAGAGSGAILFPTITGDAFGRRHAGAIAGFIFAVSGSAAAIGPYMAGLIKDASGSYDLAFLIGALCNGAAMVLVFFYRRPQAKA